MTNHTIYKRAHELTFVQFCRWMNRHKSRNSNNAKTLPSSVVECNEVGRTITVVKKLTGASCLLTKIDNKKL
jgi:hypothetical protein